jgi:hypothetical protein
MQSVFTQRPALGHAWLTSPSLWFQAPSLILFNALLLLLLLLLLALLSSSPLVASLASSLAGGHVTKR